MGLASTGTSLPSEDRGNDAEAARAARIRQDITRLGANLYDLLLPETRILPSLVHADEEICGLLYGQYVWSNGSPAPPSGRGVLVATDKRVLLIDKKPLFVRCDEISYGSVSGVSYSRTWMAETVLLHTRMGDIRMQSYNGTCANNFVAYIEDKVVVAPA